MKKNKKGFTLVELLAVIVVLIIIILLAYNIIKRNVDDTLDNTTRANAGLYIKAVNGFISEKSITDPNYDSGTLTVAELEEEGVKISGTKPDSGYVLFHGSEVLYGCLTYDGYYAIYQNGDVSKPKKGICDDSPASLNINKDFDFTGSEEIFSASLPGTYKLELWGAQGGSVSSDLYGGYGGYSVGYVTLSTGEKLYINVGGAGTNVGSTTNGGYNGGAYANSSDLGGSGGGATSITLSSGLLTQHSNNIDDVLIVAGGGGGSKKYGTNSVTNYSGTGGSGGGYIGGSGTTVNTSAYGYGTGGKQSEGGYFVRLSNSNGSNRGTFGAGASVLSYTGAGGGGGFYGGGTVEHGPAGGGSGYIANPRLFNKSMTCYNCSSTNIEQLKTTSVSCVSDKPQSECAKKGNGYAKISFIDSSSYNSNVKYLYSFGNEYTSETGGWTAKQVQSNGRGEKLPGSLYIWTTNSSNSESNVSTNNQVDFLGYTKLNVIYEITESYSTSDFGKLKCYIGNGDVDIFFNHLGVGTYYDTINISSINKAKIIFMDWDVNIKIVQVWLSK